MNQQNSNQLSFIANNNTRKKFSYVSSSQTNNISYNASKNINSNSGNSSVKKKELP